MSGALATALATALDGEVVALRPIPGGDLNDAYRATLADGTSVFVKTSPDAAPGAFAAEAAGLRWLAEPQVLPLPQVLAVADEASGPRFLALAWIDSGPPSAAADEALGRGLARLHEAGAPSFGGPDDTLRIGPLALPNEPSATWPAFYADRRLLPLAGLAEQRGALPVGTRAAIDRIATRLHDEADDLAGPPEPPARLHGDLWGGNVMTGADGRPWLIDPAAHGGHREVDLAMLRLFGGPSERAFAAYAEEHPLADGAPARVPLWQLAPLLLHAALFGAAYGPRVAAAARRYG